MKSFLKINIIISLLFFVNIVTVNAQRESMWQDYFPTNPSQEKWKEILTHKEMTEVLNLEEKIIIKLSTSELLEIYLQYPLLLDIWAYNNLQIGFDAVKNNFNGLHELLNRKDLKKEAINKYSKVLAKQDTFEIYFTQLIIIAKRNNQ